MVALLPITLLLLLDDMLMLHERALPSIGIPESVYYVAYPLIVLIAAVTLRRFFRQTNLTLLFVGLALLAFSMAVDLTYELILDVYHGVRDGVASEVAPPDDSGERADNSAAETTVVVRDGGPMLLLNEKPFSLAANLYYLAEDGSKLLGIIGWLAYLAVTAKQQIIVMLRGARHTAV